MILPERQGTEISGLRAALTQGIFRYSLLIVVIVFIVLEGYYIAVLRDRINRQTEELRNISMQLQLLKSEREMLNEELSSNKSTGEEKHGNAPEGQH